MRVLHVQKAKGVGGSERHLLELLPGLREAGLDARICVLETAGAGRFVAELRRAGVPTTVISAGRALNPLLLGGLIAQIRAQRPHVVHTHLIHADVHGQLAARAMRRPAVSSVHSTHDFYRRPAIRAIAIPTSRLACGTIAISNHVARFVEELGIARAGHVEIIPYGIEPTRWQTSPTVRRAARLKLGINDGAVAVGIAARLIPGKGHELLLDAAVMASSSAPGLRILVAGEGPNEERVRAYAERLPPGLVHVLGFVEDISSFMAACDVIVSPTLPSLSEGFGLAALEAMASGKPVIATHVGALPEVVAHGKTGYVVSPDDPREMAEALKRLVEDSALRREMGRQGMAHSVASFDVRTMVERTAVLYRRIAAQHE
jgi:glycosyltransferase involved in cell wall biosynthesis